MADGTCLSSLRISADEDVGPALSLAGRYLLVPSTPQRVKLFDTERKRYVSTFLLKDLADQTRLFPCLDLPRQQEESWKKLKARAPDFMTAHGVLRSALCDFSADGRLAVAVGNDQTARVWEMATGRCLLTLAGGVVRVCFSADGRFILTADHAGALALWRVARDPPPPVAPAMFCRVVASETVLDYEREVQAAQTCREQGNAPEAASHVRRARAQPGCARAPEALREWGLLYTHLPRGTCLGGWQSQAWQISGVRAVALDEEGRRAVTGRQDGTLTFWDLESASPLQTVRAHTSMVESVSLSGDGNTALSGSGDHTLALWDVASGACLNLFSGHRTYVAAVCFSADGRFALSGSGDGTARLWDVGTGRELCRYLDWRGRGEITAVAMSADNRLVVAGTATGAITVWELDSGHVWARLIGHQQRVRCVCFNAVGTRVLSASDDHTLLWWQTQGGCLQTLRGHERPVTSASLSADGKFALSASADCSLKLWELTTGRCLHTFEGHAGGVTSAVLSPDGRCAVSAGEDKTLRLWLLDWELHDYPPADWDEAANPHLALFLKAHTPYAGSAQGEGAPLWDEDDFQQLLHALGRAGLGWLGLEEVRRRLEAMTAAWPDAAVADRAAEPVAELPVSGLAVHDGILTWRGPTPPKAAHPLTEVAIAALRSQRKNRLPGLADCLALVFLILTIFLIQARDGEQLTVDVSGRAIPGTPLGPGTPWTRAP